MIKVVSVQEMKDIEAAADAQGVSYEAMMHRAGEGVAEIVLREFGHLETLNVVGLVGTGNNGGDALVALTFLKKAGWHARACLTRPRKPEDHLVREFLDTGGELIDLQQDDTYRKLDEWLGEASVLMDGIIGTGFQLPLKKDLQMLFAHIHSKPQMYHVVAVDCPSGVDCDSGDAAGDILSAEITACMAAVKFGLMKFPAFNYVGRLEVVDIGLPGGLSQWESVQSEMVDGTRIKNLLPKREANSHKGTYGTLLAVGGSVNYTGAIALASKAAYRIGCGLVQVGIPSPLHAALAGTLLEATWLLLPDALGVISADAAELVATHAVRADALLIGPGMGTEKQTEEFIKRFLDRRTSPTGRSKMGFRASPSLEMGGQKDLPSMVVDADGLRILAGINEWYRILPEKAILTPHPGEMAILTKLSINEIQRDRVEIARRYSATWGHVVVLKGALTVVAEPGGGIGIIPVATSALAKAGTGDVLAGMIAGLRAQGVEAFEAALAGAWLHAQAGLVAECWVGSAAGVLASDIIQSIPEAFQQIDQE